MSTYRASLIALPSAWLLALCAMLLFWPNSQAQAQSSCSLYAVSGSDIQYVRFQNNFARGNVNWYTNSSCDTAGGRISLPGDGVASATSESAALAICDANLRGSNTVAQDSGAITSGYWVCTNYAPRGSRSSKDDDEKPARPYIPSGITLNQTDLRLSAVDGFHSGIQFQRVGHDGVGILR